MRDFLKRWPWYAAVLAAYPLLYIAVTNPGQVEAADVVPVVAAGILAAVLLVGLVRPFAGTWAAAGLGAAWVILLFYLYGPANEWWLDWVRSGLEQQAAERTWYRAYPQLVHSAAWALIALAGIARLNRIAPRIPPALTGGLNVVAAVLLAFLGVQAVANLAQSGDRESGHSTPALAQAPKSGGPDIYFIVLDGYARADVLAKYYGFDNGPFLDGLRAARVPGERREPLQFLLDVPVDRLVAEPRLHPGSGRRRARPGQPRPHRALSHPARQPRRAIPARTRLSLRAPAIHLGRDGEQSVRGRFPALPRGPVRQRVPARGRGCFLAARARVEGEPRHRELPPAELRDAGRAGESAGPEVRVRPLRAAAPSLPLRPRRHGAAPRDDLGPVRVPEAAVGGSRRRTPASSPT